MTDYAILLLPAANRVYADTSPRLLRGELAVLGERGLDATIGGVTERRIAGVDYVTFATPEPLNGNDIAMLSNLSTVYALFEVLGTGPEAGPAPEAGTATAPETAQDTTADTAGQGAAGVPLLRPVPLAPLDRFDSDLLTIQKYAGKTNELFTKLLVNMTCMALERPATMLTSTLRVLDPLCGRGTTLNQAMMYGFDAAGAEVDGKDFDAYELFIKTWLKNKRVKHAADSGQLRKDKTRLGRWLDITYAPTKDEYKAGDTRSVNFRGVDTLALDRVFASRSFDMIVTDAPYGVQHGSRQQGTSAPSRSPRELLAAALPTWLRLLRPGGAVGISWNTRVLPREELVETLRSAGLTVHDGWPFDQFRHRVDQAIVRDLVVATLPGHRTAG
ncbi:TRM11 family SAM-dependent methyltransferase [Haloechinothrix aidingensis]|nr:SAM-dependent methyltransferase [Haloechinothrix aidingensis]